MAEAEELSASIPRGGVDRKRVRRQVDKLIRTLCHRGETALVERLRRLLLDAVPDEPGDALEPRARERGLHAVPRHGSSLVESAMKLRPLESMIEGWFARPGAKQEKCVVLVDALTRCDEVARRDSAGAQTPLRMELARAIRQLARVGSEKHADHALLEVRATAVRVLAELPNCALKLRLAASGEVPAALDLDVDGVRALRQIFVDAGSVRRAPPVREVDTGEMLLLWRLFIVEGVSRWIDLGCGDGRSLGRFATLNPGRSLLGVDLKGAPTVSAGGGGQALRDGLPANANFVELGPDPGSPPISPEDLAATMIRSLGRGSAKTVTLLFPLHTVQRRHDGGRRLAHELQLEIAMALLEPGGAGFLATENPTAFRTALIWLGQRDDVSSISYGGAPLSESALQELGVYGFSPTRRDLDPSQAAEGLHGDPEAVLGTFRWALPVLFTKC